MNTPLKTAVQAVIAEWEEHGFATDGQMKYLCKALEAEQAQAVEPVAWIVLDEDKVPIMCAPARQMCNDHINDAINDFDIAEASKWVVRKFVQTPSPPPLVEPKDATSPTTGMTIEQRILHVGGRNNEAGYVEFGSVQAVKALVHHVLRYLPDTKPTGDHVPEAAFGNTERAELIAKLRTYSDELDAMEDAGIQAQIDFAKAADMLEADAREIEATEKQVEILSDELSKCSKAQQAQAVEPMAWIERDMQFDDFDPDSVTCATPVGTAEGWEWVPLYLQPAPTPAADHIPDAGKMVGERAKLISRLLDIFKHDWGNPVFREAADMLEADAQDAFTVGLACQPKPQSLSFDLLDRLSKTLTRLGYSTPEGGMEHFGSQIESQLYNLCRGVDALLAQQVAVPLPLTDDEIMQLGRLAADQEIDISKPTWEQFSLHLARAIEAHHGIGAKP